jgi:hypothetical protein
LTLRRAACSESLHEFIESTLAATIASELETPQDFDARNFRILAQPLGDLSRKLRHYGTAAARFWRSLRALPRHHATEPSMARLQGKSDAGIELSENSRLPLRWQERAWTVLDRVDHARSTAAQSCIRKLFRGALTLSARVRADIKLPLPLPLGMTMPLAASGS